MSGNSIFQFKKCIVISIVHGLSYAFYIVESYFSLFLNIFRGTYLHDTNRDHDDEIN